MRAQIGLQFDVADGVVGGRVCFECVHGQNCADIRMNDQSGQGAQHKFTVVEPFVAAALGVGDGDDAVEAGKASAAGCNVCASVLAKAAVLEVVPG